MVQATRFAIGDVLKTSISVFGKNLPAACVLGVLAHVPGFAIALAIANQPALSLYGLDHDTAVLLALLAGDPFAAAGLAYVVVRTLRSGPPALGEALVYAMRAFPLVLLTNCILVVAIFLGLLALILPGVIVCVVFFVAPQVAAVECSGVVAAFRRSRALTKGHRIALFGLTLLLFVPDFAAHPLPTLMAFPPQYDHLWDVFLSMVSSIAWGVVAGVAYHDLRIFKEGDGQRIAEVFA